MSKLILILATLLLIISQVLAGCTTSTTTVTVTKTAPENQATNEIPTLESPSPDQILTPTIPIGRIAFVSNERYIHIINIDGTGETRLTEGSYPVWSPDGKKIAYYLPKDDMFSSGDLYIINADGKNRMQIVSEYYSNFHRWSPDGKKLVFEKDGNIYTVDVDGTNIIKLTTSGDCGEPSFSPDGTKILYASGGGVSISFSGVNKEISYIHIINTDGSNDRTIVEKPYYTLQGFGSPSWSSDGKKIIYCCNGDIVIVDSDGTNEMILAEGSNPVWSPNGNKIAYLSEVQASVHYLFVMNPDGTNKIKVIEDNTYCCSYNPISWAPDGNKIVFETDRNIYIINIDGTNMFRLTESEDCTEPTWSR